MTQYQYVPGCSLHGMARAYDQSFQLVAKHLGIELAEVRDWACCGATAARSLDETLGLALAARTLALAQKKSARLFAPCSMCYNNLAHTAHALQDTGTRTRVNAALKSLGLEYTEPVRVAHPLEIFAREIGFARIAEKVTRPLRDLRVVAYYGCLLTRPRDIAIEASDANPMMLDDLLNALGATVLPFAAKTRCCGGSLLLTHPDAALVASRRVLDEAQNAGARRIAVACPLCKMSLDDKQSTIEKRFGVKYNIQVSYFTQLMTAAFGI
ncbi:MAG: CoB--CoM heterodisulfide reductase iron-sulfur subunit B family protein [Chloroflexi bacterium]|nr:CoB--CoM heterodisulfide reductase iron-sulfur subunit B family protein [Chloroflexota bacterium]